jgi:hypothetical protein
MGHLTYYMPELDSTENVTTPQVTAAGGWLHVPALLAKETQMDHSSS